MVLSTIIQNFPIVVLGKIVVKGKIRQPSPIFTLLVLSNEKLIVGNLKPFLETIFLFLTFLQLSKYFYKFL